MKRVSRGGGVSLVLTVAVLLVAVSAFAQDPAKELVRVIGADSMAHTVMLYANEFGNNNPNCSVLVSGGPSGIGWDRLLDGTAEIAMMSYLPTKSQEEQAKTKGLIMQEAVIGWGGIVFITNPSNPVESLTVDQVRKLLTGQAANWKDVGGPEKPVQVFGVSEDVRGGTARFMTEEVLKGPFAPSAKMLAYFRSIPPAVSETDGSIGFIRMRNLERLVEQGQDKRVKVIGVKKDDRSPAVTPSRESIDEGTYPITRPFLLYMPKESAGKCAMDFFKFCEARNSRPKAAGSALGGRK